MSNELFLQKYIDTMSNEIAEMSKSRMITLAELETQKAVVTACNEKIAELVKVIEVKQNEVNEALGKVTESATQSDNKDNQLREAHDKINERQEKINSMSETIANLKMELLSTKKDNDNQSNDIAELLSELRKYKDAEAAQVTPRKRKVKEAVPTVE